MRLQRPRFLLFLIVFTLTATPPCLAQSSSLAVSSAGGRPGDTISLDISLGASGSSPASTLSWTLHYSPSDFAGVTVTPGPSASAAGKLISCKPASGSLKCVLWGMNANAIPSGVVAKAAMTLSPSTANTATSVQLTSGLAADPAGAPVSMSASSGTVTIQQQQPPPPPVGNVTFLGVDLSTQGNWKSRYGAEGLALAGDSVVNPSYVAPTVSGQATYVWGTATGDVRALQMSAGTDRLAAAWYSPSSFSIDLNFTDQSAHQVAIYCVDWDGYGGSRSQRIDVLDANGNVLDTHQLSNFYAGQYLLWSMSGHMKIRATSLNGNSNALIEGLFFGGPRGGVSFEGVDTITKGNWKSKYGRDGYTVLGDSTVNPSFVDPLISDELAYVWSTSTNDVRGLQTVAGTDRVAVAWYSPTSFTIDLVFRDQSAHQVAIYCVDWDGYGGPRSQRIDVLDAIGNVLDTQQLSNFSSGQYLVWTMRGHMKIRATSLNSNSTAVVEGLFFQ